MVGGDGYGARTPTLAREPTIRRRTYRGKTLRPFANNFHNLRIESIVFPQRQSGNTHVAQVPERLMVLEMPPQC